MARVTKNMIMLMHKLKLVTSNLVRSSEQNMVVSGNHRPTAFSNNANDSMHPSHKSKIIVN